MLDMHKLEMEHDRENVFGIKILKYTKNSIERQILKSVLIQENKHHHIINSKTEYNRCAVPRLTSKLGKNIFKRWEEEKKEEKRREIQEKIRMLKK